MTCTCGLEQKINARIAELEIDNNYCYECGIDYQNYAKDELRKLLE